MVVKPRKNSHTIGKYTKRRNGVSYESADSIRYSLLTLNQCSCSCHNEDASNSTTRDSVISRHCVDCDDVRANDPAIMMRRQEMLCRNNSSVSSGYGSEHGGSQYLPTSPPDDNFLGFNLNPILGHRSSVPRKSSTGTIRARSSHQRCSVPVLREYASDDDEIVFV